MAASIASDPEFQKKKLSKLGSGIIVSNDSTNCTYGSERPIAHWT